MRDERGTAWPVCRRPVGTRHGSSGNGPFGENEHPHTSARAIRRPREAQGRVGSRVRGRGAGSGRIADRDTHGRAVVVRAGGERVSRS